MQIPASSTAFVETLSFDDPTLANALFGPHNAHLNVIAERTGADLSTRGTTLAVTSDDPALRERILNLFTQFYGLLRSGHALQNSDLEQGLQLLESDPGSDLRRSFRDEAVLSLPKKTVTARNAAQRAYLETLRSNEMVFSVGPAGTGKTYLAVAMAVHMLNARRVRRIILTRPAVEAGEKLGFLPGDLAEKVNPYLRPLHDALLDMLGPQKMASLQETGIIEVAPLAFMRGRTLNDAFIILDEAQNTTREQMKMFLTRLGFGSRAAITGDITQIDLPAQGEDSASRSGLVHALHVLKGVKGVAFRHFTSADVVRHPLVGRIVQAYDDYEKLPSSHQ
ncbi:PhoH family protein [Bilophila wadsworthia]|uniref:PhoH family protein n=1 Tax=Bilophila wadsworthia TaxID=35833 RepID=UPI0022E93DAF|nr:PhoH family protein [Bilophila wadsworthia]